MMSKSAPVRTAAPADALVAACVTGATEFRAVHVHCEMPCTVQRRRGQGRRLGSVLGIGCGMFVLIFEYRIGFIRRGVLENARDDSGSQYVRPG